MTHARWARLNHAARPPRPRAWVALVAMSCVAPNVVLSLSAEATPPASVTRAQLPPQALTSGQVATINAVACTGVNTCVAVGAASTSGGLRPLALDERNGAWIDSKFVSLPSDAVTASGPGAAGVVGWQSVACTVGGSCVAVGTYKTSAGYEPLISRETNGVWTNAVRPSLPSGATTVNQSAALFAVTCTGAHCVAVGTYLDSKSNQRTLEITLPAAGPISAYSTPVSPSLPVDALGSDQVAELTSVACSSDLNCVAGGGYVTASGYQPLLISQLGTAKPKPTSVALPADAAAPANAVANLINAVTCPAPGACVAVGEYETSAGYVPLTETQASGQWASAVALLVPTLSSPVGALIGGLNAVSCVAVGQCVAVGAYGTASQQLPLLATETSTTWSNGATGTIPSGASVPLVGRFTSVRCFAAGECLVTGSYLTTAGYEGLLSTPATAPGPPKLTSLIRANARVTVAWTAPAYVGNTPITSYTVSADPGGSTCTSSVFTQCVVHGLTNGVHYTFTVRATNAAGTSGPSAPLAAVPATTPGLAKIKNVVARVGALRVNIVAPSSSGGSPVTTYQYSLNGGSTWHSRVPSSASTTLMITALSRHHTYRVSVRAVNGLGAGAASNVVTATTG